MANDTLYGKRYRLMEVLGRGGMGVVYRAHDHLTGQPVALKQMVASPVTLQFASLAHISSFEVALAHEFQTLASLRHAHIISVLDYGFHQGLNRPVPFFTMELLEKHQDLREAGRGQSPETGVNLVIQVLQALAYLHRRGILHRDLKPTNILVQPDGLVRVLDFGLAVTGKPTEQAVGTLPYMAPELLQGNPSSEVSDLYAVGMMAYEMLTGQYPFALTDVTRLTLDILYQEPDWTPFQDGQGRTPPAPSSLAAVEDTFIISKPPPTDEPLPPPPTDVAPLAGLSGSTLQAIGAVIRRLVDKNPQRRYQDANDVIRALSEAIGQSVPVETAVIRESYLQAAQFVGRQHELSQLREALQRIVAPPDGATSIGSAWLVGGESGVGKSRLLDELRIRAVVDGVLVVRAQIESEGSPSYQLWRDPLRRLVLAAGIDDADAAVLKLIVPDIEVLLERPVPDVPILDPKGTQQRLIAVITALLERQTQPVLILLEDLQWARQESLDLLAALNSLAGRLPLMIAANYRNDERPDLPQVFPDMQSLQLQRLAPDQIAALSTAMLGAAGEQPTLVEFLSRETEGNIFFLVEVVRALAEEAGQLDKVGSKTLPAHIFTGGVRQIVQRRLQRLPSEAYPVLQLAAIIGRTPDLNALQTLVPATPLERWLETCANAAVLEIADGKWRFAHDKLREGVLEALSIEERRPLHGQVAVTLETLYPNDNTQAATLAYHWGMAENSAKEGHYSGIAAEQAYQVASYQEAIRYYERALAVLSESVEDQKQRAFLLAGLGVTYVRLGKYEQSRQLFEEVLAIGETLNDDVLIALGHLRIGDNLQRQRYSEEAIVHLDQSLEIYRALNDSGGIIDSLRQLGMVARFQGDFPRASQYFGEAYQLAQSVNDTHRHSLALFNLGNIARFQAQLPEAERYYRECLEISRLTGDRLGIANTLTELAEVARFQGQLQEASAYQAESLAIYRVIGEKWGMAACLNNMGCVKEMEGDIGKADAFFRDSLNIFREIGERYGIALGLSNTGRMALLRRDLDTAQKDLEESLAINRELNYYEGIANVLRDLGLVAQAREDYATAQALMVESQTVYREHEDWRGVATLDCALGQLALEQGHLESARNYFKQGLQEASQRNLVPHVLSAIAGLAGLAATEGHSERALEWLVLVFSNAEIEMDIMMNARALRERLEAELGSEAAQAALARGESLKLEDIVAKLLATQ